MPSYSLGLTGQSFDFNLPSGNTCRMNHADLPKLIAAGVVDSIDQLTSLVQTEHVDRVKKGKKNRHVQPPPGAMPEQARVALELMRDPKRWGTLEGVVNAVVVQCVEEPRVLPALAPGTERSPQDAAALMAGTAFAVDNVSLIDRMAIFAEAMAPILQGQEAMKPFRDGGEAGLAGVADVEDVQPPAERNAGDQ